MFRFVIELLCLVAWVADSEPLPQKRSVFVQFRHSAARIMLEHPSVNELDVQRRELKELMFDNEDDEDSDSESNVDDLEAKREALSNLTKVPSSATAASATRKAQENLRELWFPASASSQTFTLVSENLDSLQKLVQKQKALLSEVGKKYAPSYNTSFAHRERFFHGC